ncbi:MAG TPA: serine protease [Dehalococcoidia bacterium]|nr:serine protease [Dehalococcoidia bacterium]
MVVDDMLVNTPDVTGPLAILIGIGATLLIISIVAVIRSQRRSPAAGLETMVGKSGVARTALSPEGTVHVEGELWQAVSHGEKLEAGSRVIVTGIEGLRLAVKRKEEKDG